MGLEWSKETMHTPIYHSVHLRRCATFVLLCQPKKKTVGKATALLKNWNECLVLPVYNTGAVKKTKKKLVYL